MMPNAGYPPWTCDAFSAPQYPLFDTDGIPGGTLASDAFPGGIITLYNNTTGVIWDRDWTVKAGGGGWFTTSWPGATPGSAGHGARMVFALSLPASTQGRWRCAMEIITPRTVETQMFFRWYMMNINATNTYARWMYRSQSRDWEWRTVRNGTNTEINTTNSQDYDLGVSIERYSSGIVTYNDCIGGRYSFTGNCSSSLSTYAKDGVLNVQYIYFVDVYSQTNCPAFEVNFKPGVCVYPCLATNLIEFADLDSLGWNAANGWFEG